MPKRTDINKILLIGSGPIVIGQACEFDYSGTQACRILMNDGYDVILVNSNPATIMTDPELSYRTYIEPITLESLEKIIIKEKPDAILPTLGGQTALNVAVELYEKGILEKNNIELIGAKYDVIKKAENRDSFRKCIQEINLNVPISGFVHNISEAEEVFRNINRYPVIIRASFTLGGTGGGIAYNKEDFLEKVSYGLKCSPVSEVLIEESVLGWKEYELEIMRDHTGDSITVAPIQTLTDKEYQTMRDAAVKIIRKIGVETGGANIQFAINPNDGKMVVIEMNPRVSRSSALASKATGFPIAKIAAKLSVGYTLDEIQNDITKTTPASFEPVIDYCVVKIPRFTFEKFKGTEDLLGISMKSVGEIMTIGRTFKEAFQKGFRSLEIGASGFTEYKGNAIFIKIQEKHKTDSERIKYEENLLNLVKKPSSKRFFYIREALELDWSIEKIYELTKIDKWFLNQFKEIIDFEKYLKSIPKQDFFNNKNLFFLAKQNGFSDKELATIFKVDELEVRHFKENLNITPSFKMVDTCAGEFEAFTPYFYSTFDEEDEG